MHVRGKSIVVAGAAVIAADRNEPAAGASDHFVEADLCDPASIADAASSIGNGVEALCNIAGLPPTSERGGLSAFLCLRMDSRQQRSLRWPDERSPAPGQKRTRLNGQSPAPVMYALVDSIRRGRHI